MCLCLAALLVCRCSSARHDSADFAELQKRQAEAQELLQQHNAGQAEPNSQACIILLQSLLEKITGEKYVFEEYAQEPWATGGKAAKFVPFQSNLGRRKQIVTIVIDDKCTIQGLIWPE